jgi:uncharacterized membrane protein
MDSGREHCSIVLVLTTRSWGGKILLNFVVIQSQITTQNFFDNNPKKTTHQKKKKKKKKKKLSQQLSKWLYNRLVFLFIYFLLNWFEKIINQFIYLLKMSLTPN